MLAYDLLAFTHALLYNDSDGILPAFNLVTFAHRARSLDDLALSTALVAPARDTSSGRETASAAKRKRYVVWV